jgi:23S rRNA pseudouridine1911/1915/1917 synthase
VSVVSAVASEAGERLDVAVSRATGLSRSRSARLVDAGAVRVGGIVRARSYRLETGDRIEIDMPDPEPPPAPEEIDVPVVFEDRWLLVVAKPAGLVVHPAPGHPGGTLVNALLARAGRLPGPEIRPGIVHRLDAGTSGLMIVAKDEEAFGKLQDQLAAREISRIYLALVEGGPPAAGEIDAPVGRSPRHRKKMAVVSGGKEAKTSYKRLEQLTETSLLEVRPLTGRTHQIRVHLGAAGYPVVGDPVYGRNRKLARRLELTRPFLHAWALAFTHPMTGELVDLKEALPVELERALALARG